MIALLLLLFALDRAVLEAIDAPSSVDRERGAYALGRLYDPVSREDRTRFEQTVLGASTGGERAAALRGACDRTFEGGLPSHARELVLRSFDDRDPSVIAVAAECTERLDPKLASKTIAQQLDTKRGEATVLPLLTAAGKVGDPSLREPAVQSADRIAVRLDGVTGLDGRAARALGALASLGVDVEPALKAVEARESRETAPDPLRVMRSNRVRAVKGDAAALSALVESANVAADLHLRREAADLIASLPRDLRVKALASLASRLDDFDGPVRATVIRELSRSSDAGEWIEPMLLRAAEDPYRDLRFQAVMGLADRAALGKLSDDARARAAKLKAAEKDPLVLAAWRRL